MTAQKLWLKIEAVLFYLANMYVVFLAYAVIVYHPKVEYWTFWRFMVVVIVISFWWKGFKDRLAKFIRESLRAMIMEELAQSRIEFATWLREDSPWRVVLQSPLKE